MKIGFVSLGCPKNQLDTEVMLNELRNAGYEITPEETEADIIVINTCAFIEAAKRESIDNILDVAWLKTNHTLKGIIVTGCMTERYREEVLKEFPEVDAILGIGSIHDIVEAVQSVERGERGYTSFRPKDEVELGGDRQKLHEKIREYSVETAARVKLEGGENDLLDKLKADPAFHLDDAALAEILDVKQFIGCAPSQTRAFVEEAVRPVLEACGAGDGTDEVRV